MKLPELKAGELLIGGFVDATGKGYWCALLAGEYEPDKWQNQMAKAALIGVDLPNRAELVIMHEKFPEQFKKKLGTGSTPRTVTVTSGLGIRISAMDTSSTTTSLTSSAPALSAESRWSNYDE